MEKGDKVRLKNGVNKMPKGAVGTITWVYKEAYGGYEAYEVEFESRIPGIGNYVTTVHSLDLEPAN